MAHLPWSAPKSVQIVCKSLTHHWLRGELGHAQVASHAERDDESDAGHKGDRVSGRTDAGQLGLQVFVYVSQRRPFVVVHGHWRVPTAID